MSETVLILIGLLIAESLILLYVIHSWKKERMELTKMIAARNYGEYESFNVPHKEGKPPPKDRKSMVERQQKRMSERHGKGGAG